MQANNSKQKGATDGEKKVHDWTVEQLCWIVHRPQCPTVQTSVYLTQCIKTLPLCNFWSVSGTSQVGCNLSSQTSNALIVLAPTT